ncbi:MAG: FadR family transcriptional regulator [Hyphomonadaceae bacterium]|nr:FadR family transcriptional regulator [Hyphomonadaceae bacterium]
MTRQRRSLVAAPSAGKRALLRPLPPARNLTDEVIGRIAKEIRGGRLAPGARLPTEQALMTAMGVSRTVVREAVAALRADGLVTTRQGSGAYVADASRVPFRIDPRGLSTIEDVLEVMELRLALEVEAAALAAERMTPQRLLPITRALRAIEDAIRKGEAAVNEDFAFHRAIAEASGNGRFAELLEFLGRHVIPRQSVRVALVTPAEQRQYLMRIQQEHARIYAGIRDGDPGEARKAMRSHLRRGLMRYRRLAERQQRVA